MTSTTSIVRDRYVESAVPVLLTGVQSIGRLLVEQHARDARAGAQTATFVSGYRGSPLGGLDSTLQRLPGGLAAHDIHLVPGLNEELGATAVWGSQVALPGQRQTRDGVVGVWYGKAPGVDRAGDAIRHGNVLGANPRGGVLVLAGDDPGAKSSTLPSASERTLASYRLPVLFPRSSDDLIRLGLYGVALSRATGLWAAIKIVADVADGLWSVDTRYDQLGIAVPRIEWNGSPWTYHQARAATVPWSRDAEAELVGPRRQALIDFAEANPLDAIELDPPGARLGVIAAGKTFDDTVQALTDLGIDETKLTRSGIRLLRLGLISPLAPGVVRRFASGLDQILVVEEKGPFIETQLRELLYGTAAAPVLLGEYDDQRRPLVPTHGALSVSRIAAALRRFLPSELAVIPEVRPRAALPVLSSHRTAYFCSGCPHNRSTVVPEGSLAGGGIGCHAMTVRMPHLADQMTGITQMGGEGAQWIGQASFTETPHLFQNLGDGTFFHSGQLAIQACVEAGVDITYKLLYNSAVAMTGGQHADGALPVPAVARKLLAEGVRRVIICAEEPRRYRRSRLPRTVAVWHRDRLDEAQRALRDTPGVTVLIYDQQCAAEKRRDRKRTSGPTMRVAINEAVCEGCGDCAAKSNCLSVQPVATEFGRKTRIDQSSCNVDYSCLDGDCPAFFTYEVNESAPRTEADAAPTVADPNRPAIASSFDLLLAGIGGTGVVTANQILAVAARSEGWSVAGLDQTGLSQKAGPVTSHLRIRRDPHARPGNHVTSTGADCVLAFDAMVAAENDVLAFADPSRTRAFVSTAITPTGAEVRGLDASTDMTSLLARIEATSATYTCLDTADAAIRLFDTTTPANMILLGLAFQRGGLPMSSSGIEAAITTNGVDVDTNLAAFRWGRALTEHPDALPVRRHDTPRASQHLLAERPMTGETHRVSLIRATALAEYQNEGMARRFLDLVEAAWSAECRLGDDHEFSTAVARGLHHLMAYKDEYEVARLLLADDTSHRPGVQKIRYRLHPPLLRALGLSHKISLSVRWRPMFRILAAGKVLRGTPFDPFGHAAVRRLERELRDDYIALIAELTSKLDPNTYATSVAAAAAAELVRGYEDVKLAGVKGYHARLAELGLRRAT
ncbi:indolepyruvate ferredoxin oxidoreductase family protein [Kribbella kalugense]|uniref:Indolepyruvate ferredoxin oxidoreductase n=1 Tax=Kribbella kalugense TaxID=2512221 RepID=A0A4R8A3H6_9ACTN|nr:indolepyruvate ferredoxin oxidoreductase family protein [Kribbella kalugense]TDW24191.1 indolepyruvate ferredoxin oxidoreductase [Kribbella kalugense]